MISWSMLSALCPGVFSGRLMAWRFTEKFALAIS
jgi:hypothetical protein